MDDVKTKARHHAVALRQCALFADGDHVAAAMTEAADFLDHIARSGQGQSLDDSAGPSDLVIKGLSKRLDDD
nr:hypothetical protein [Neorhizobium tomejilense]